jgi:hypothetical protein
MSFGSGLVNLARALKQVGLKDWIAGAALLVAVAALVVSLRTSHFSEKQSTIAQLLFDEAHSLVLVGEIDDSLTLSIAPSRKDIAIETAEIYFPGALTGNEDAPLHPPSLRMSLSGIHKAAVRDLTPALRFEKGDGYLLRPLPDSIPFVITTHFLVGGTSLVDQSLYVIPISVDFVMGPTGKDNVSIEQLRFLGVRFVKHLDKTPQLDALNKYWREATTFGDHGTLMSPSGKVLMRTR